MNSIIPEGSVLEPTLLNLLFNSLFEMKLRDNTTLFGFVDNIAIVTVANIA